MTDTNKYILLSAEEIKKLQANKKLGVEIGLNLYREKRIGY